MLRKLYGLAVKAAILDYEGRALLIRRSAANKNFVAKWEWPGGKCDPGESFDEALLREVKEETNLEIEITGLVGSTDFEMPLVHVILLCLEARVVGGDIVLSDEHDESAWVPLSESSRFDLVDNVKPLMLEYAAMKGAD